MYLSERSRLKTFTNRAEYQIHPKRLAQAGFYSTGQKDQVKCVYCNGIARDWSANDNPQADHRRMFPGCPLVLANFNAREIDEPKFCSYESRLATYDSWPLKSIWTPETLADAGFYYFGQDDHLRCFFCGIQVNDLESEKDPTIEHAKWNPPCRYLRQKKGKDFIDECKNIEYKPEKKELFTPPPLHVTNHEVYNQMKMAPARAALSIGLDESAIKLVINSRLRETGKGYATADELIGDVLNFQEKSEETKSRCYASAARQNNNTGNRPFLSEQFPTLEKAAETHQDRKTKNMKNKSRSFASLLGSTEELKKKETQKTETSYNLEMENKKLKDARKCIICIDREINVVFAPCGHLTVCINCAASLKDCPLCRRVINDVIKTFLP